MYFALLWGSPVAHATDLTIDVTDPLVRSVELHCNGRDLRAPVLDGTARFPGEHGPCSVRFVRMIGEIDRSGDYTCTTDGCSRNELRHRIVPPAEGRLVVVLRDASASQLELRCADGYRERADVIDLAAVFDNLKTGPCDLFWRGSQAGRALGLQPSAGLLYCENPAGSGNCTRQ